NYKIGSIAIRINFLICARRMFNANTLIALSRIDRYALTTWPRDLIVIGIFWLYIAFWSIFDISFSGWIWFNCHFFLLNLSNWSCFIVPSVWINYITIQSSNLFFDFLNFENDFIIAIL